eukprot:scaffold11135_cov128-Skeletonema_marinoi.AAC.3
MDRGRKAMPVQNKACMERHVQRCQERHKQKLQNMKSNIDNKCPRGASHLKTKAKKNALMEERFEQIETENRILLEKMSHIMRCKGDIDCTNDSIKYSKPKNKERRKRELKRITKENQQILNRIQAARPTYNHRKWKDEAKVNDRILANICEFKQPARKDERPMIGDEDSIFGYLDFYDSVPEESEGETSLF